MSTFKIIFKQFTQLYKDAFLRMKKVIEMTKLLQIAAFHILNCCATMSPTNHLLSVFALSLHFSYVLIKPIVSFINF